MTRLPLSQSEALAIVRHAARYSRRAVVLAALILASDADHRAQAHNATGETA